MTSLHASELESTATDSVASSPRSEHQHDLHQARARFMCSFGGKILPRPHDNQLRYVGGETRIVAVNRCTSFSAMLSKLSKLAGTHQSIQTFFTVFMEIYSLMEDQIVLKTSLITVFF